MTTTTDARLLGHGGTQQLRNARRGIDTVSTLDNVTAELFSDWASSVVEEWLPGFSGPDENGEQFRIRQLIAEDEPEVLLFQVETLDGREAVRFKLVAVAVRVP